MQVEPTLHTLEEILAPWRETIGQDFAGYRNHCYRVLHFCFALKPCTEEEKHKLIIAACFHDIGIWTNNTVDYLPPSIQKAREYLTLNQLDSWIPEVEEIINLHHRIRPVRDSPSLLVELFRKGDLVDFSMMWVRCGLTRETVRTISAQFPNEGFYKRLRQLAFAWFSKHPFRIPPFMKW